MASDFCIYTSRHRWDNYLSIFSFPSERIWFSGYVWLLNYILCSIDHCGALLYLLYLAGGRSAFSYQLTKLLHVGTQYHLSLLLNFDFWNRPLEVWDMGRCYKHFTTVYLSNQPDKKYDCNYTIYVPNNLTIRYIMYLS